MATTFTPEQIKAGFTVKRITQDYRPMQYWAVIRPDGETYGTFWYADVAEAKAALLNDLLQNQG